MTSQSMDIVTLYCCCHFYLNCLIIFVSTKVILVILGYFCFAIYGDNQNSIITMIYGSFPFHFVSTSH